jgi:hypothetical protein
MAPAHWICAVELGAHPQVIDAGVGSAVWSHFAASWGLLVPSVEQFVSQPMVSCDKQARSEKGSHLGVQAGIRSQMGEEHSQQVLSDYRDLFYKDLRGISGTLSATENPRP